MPKGNNNEDQFKFLISCIRHSNNGKIDFEKVAEECEIITKGAAAKRYERMMKAHGIHQPQGPTGRDTGVQPLKSATKANESESPTKKRKRAPAKKKSIAAKMESDDDEGEERAVEMESNDMEIKAEYNEAVESDAEEANEDMRSKDDTLGELAA